MTASAGRQHLLARQTGRIDDGRFACHHDRLLGAPMRSSASTVEAAVP
jgi:hypothetical protein